MGNVIFLSDHARASSASTNGRATSSGQEPSGQFEENQPSAFSKRLTLMSEPASSAASFLPSSKTRELTVDSGTPVNLAYWRAILRRSSMPDMAGISVSLPAMSTVKLPSAFPVGSGQSTGMDLATILTNIERHLKRIGIKSAEASRRAGRPDAIRNLKRKVKAGVTKGSLRADTLEALAAALQTTADDLKRPPPSSPAPISGLREYLLEQRALIDRQIAALDQAEMAVQNRPRRKKR